MTNKFLFRMDDYTLESHANKKRTFGPKSVKIISYKGTNVWVNTEHSLQNDVKDTGMRTKAIAVEGIKPCCYQKKATIELKSQQPWTAVSALLGMAQLANELCVST